MGKFEKVLKQLRLAKFAKSAKGVASVEFALIVPLMTTLFFGILEFSQAMASNRKVSYAATMLVDLVSQEQFLSQNDITGIYTAVEQVLEPYGIENPTMWVVSVTMDSDGDALIDWSLDDDLNEPFTRGSTFSAISENEIDLNGDDSLISDGSSLVIAYIEYPFTSTLSSIMIDEITFTNHATRWPRRSSQIIYCDDAGNCSDD